MRRLLATVPVAFLLLAPMALSARGGHSEWDFAPLSHLKRLRAEQGSAANSHPAAVAEDTLTGALGSVHFMGEKGEAPLFAPAELPAMARAMAEALSLAQPGEDLELFSTWKRESGFFDRGTAVTARVFLVGGKLNLIVSEPRLDFLLSYNIDNRMPYFDYGSRFKARTAVLKAAGAEFPRPDWVVLSLAGQPAPVLARTESNAHPAVPVAPSTEDRLRELKRFREQNLISEAEYAQAKQDLLRAVVKPKAE